MNILYSFSIFLLSKIKHETFFGTIVLKSYIQKILIRFRCFYAVLLKGNFVDLIICNYLIIIGLTRLIIFNLNTWRFPWRFKKTLYKIKINDLKWNVVVSQIKSMHFFTL